MQTYYVIKNKNGLVVTTNKPKFGKNHLSTNAYNAYRFVKKQVAERLAEKLNATYYQFQRRKKDVFFVARQYDRVEENVVAFNFVYEYVLNVQEKNRIIGVNIGSITPPYPANGISRWYDWITISGKKLKLSGQYRTKSMSFPKSYCFHDMYDLEWVMNHGKSTLFINIAKYIREEYKDKLKEFNMN